MEQTTLPYARCGNKPVAAASYREEYRDLKCYECDGKLSYRRGHERTSKNGESYEVRAHFYHCGESTCSGESVEHALAKDIVANQTKFDFFLRCGTCKQDAVVLYGADVGETKMEYRWYDADKTLFIPDVACLDSEGKIQGAIEILHTHAIPTEKVEAFARARITWVEVEATHVIEQYMAGKVVARVQRCSYRKSGRQCSACDTKESEQNELRARAKLVEEHRRKESEASRLPFILLEQLLQQQQPLSRPKPVQPSYVYPPIEPRQCKTCLKYYSQYEPKNIYGGFCFSCDCDADFARYNRLTTLKK